MALEELLAEAQQQADSISGQLTDRTRGLLDSIASLSKLNSERPAAVKEKPDIPLVQRLPPVRPALDEADEAPPTLTPRLAEILESQAPEASELNALHGGLDSLQSTLGVAYMLLAAEAKAEALQSELSDTRGDLATTLSSGEELLVAHERCVDDYAELRTIVESARTEAESLAAELGKENGGGSNASLQMCATLLTRLGSSVVLPSKRGGPEQAAASTDEQATAEAAEAKAAAETMRKRLADAEEHQRTVAAQLHSREAQLTLVRQELLAAEGERERYVGIVSDAAKKLSEAAGAPGDRTARGVGKRAKSVEAATAKEEARLEELLRKCVRATSEWKQAERDHGEKHADGLLAPPPVQTPTLLEVQGGGEVPPDLGDEDETHLFAPSPMLKGGLPGAMPHVLKEQTNSPHPPAASPLKTKASRHAPVDGSREPPPPPTVSTQSKQRRLARQAAAEEARRLAEQAIKEARELCKRRSELASLNGTLREMVMALELERSARMRLQEVFARDWTMQSAALKRVFHEQDVVLEVALHKLELHGGAELAQALSFKLQALRGKLAELVEDEALVEARKEERERTFDGLLAGAAGKGGKAAAAGGKAAVPEAIANAMASVQSFFAGGGTAKRHRKGSGGSGHRTSSKGNKPAKAGSSVWGEASAVAAAAAAAAGDTPAALPTANQQAAKPPAAAPDVERLGSMAKSVLEHLHERLAAAAEAPIAPMAC